MQRVAGPPATEQAYTPKQIEGYKIIMSDKIHQKSPRKLFSGRETEIIVWGHKDCKDKYNAFMGSYITKGFFFLSLNTSFVWTNDSTLRITVHEITSHEAFWRCSEGRAHFLGEEGVHFTLLSGRIGQRRGEIFYYFYYSYLCADAAGGWVQG